MKPYADKTYRVTNSQKGDHLLIIMYCIVEEVDICPGLVILMGIHNELLIRKLICLPHSSSLQDVVIAYRSFEATRYATSAICAPSDQLCAVSAYKKRRDKSTLLSPTSIPTVSCQCCTR